MVPLFSATLSNLLPSRAISCDDGFEGKFNVALDEPGYHYSLGGRLANFPALCVTVCVHITLLFTISLEFTIRVNYRDSLNNIGKTIQGKYIWYSIHREGAARR